MGKILKGDEMLHFRKSTYTVFWMLLILAGAICARPEKWHKKQVDLRLNGMGKIKAVHYPKEKPVRFNQQQKVRKSKLTNRIPARFDEKITLSDQTTYTGPYALAIEVNDPPLDGFVPWVVVSITDERKLEGEFEAVTEYAPAGSFLCSNPQTEYAIGIFDTGASAHVMGYENSLATCLTGTYLTSNTIEITGVTGSVDARVSQPIGLFAGGLNLMDTNGVLTGISSLVGQSNIAIAVGDIPPVNTPDLVTAIGSPLAVYFSVAVDNETVISRTWDGNDINSPQLTFYPNDDPGIPEFANRIPLELRPLGGVSVQYIIDPLSGLDFVPSSPSVIIGNSSQSLYFVSSVDAYDDTYSAIDKDRFLFDTGAQITVVGSRIGARLGLDPAAPEFEVDIVGVTGDLYVAPGFYLDRIEIPALGQWLSFDNVPVVLLDIASPEGGTLDGIIGMNLFVDFNLVVRGGGLFGQDDPAVDFEPILQSLPGDIAPPGGDGVVNGLDLNRLIQSWLLTDGDPNFCSDCDLAPIASPDNRIDFDDFTVLAHNWMTQ